MAIFMAKFIVLSRQIDSIERSVLPDRDFFF